MAAINDTVFDNGLTTVDTNGTRIDITSTTGGDPGTTYATVTANTLGNATVNTGAPGNSTSGTGRSVQVPAITTTNGAVTNTGTAGWWALNNGSTTVYASGALTTSQAVTSGNRFTLDLVEISIRDAT